MSYHINPDLTPATGQIISTYNKIVLIEDDKQREQMLDALIEMHGETIVQMSVANQKKGRELAKRLDSA